MPLLNALRFALLAAMTTASSCVHADPSDTVLARFFSIWDDNARVTPDEVKAHYARQVVYYGKRMSNDQVYANKSDFVRRWPDRRYAVVPGSAAKGCDPQQTHCSVSVTLAYRAASGARRASAHGLTRVTLTLEQQDGTLKIVREAGHPVSDQ